MHTMDVRLPCHASFCFREFDFLRPTSTKKYVNFTGTMTIVKRLLSRLTHRLYDIPVLVLMPHSRCNCRCVMCDIWKANHEKKELSTEWLQRNSEAFERLGVREVVLSGGEALMHSNLWNFCKVLRERRMRVVILSTGLLLEKYAPEIVANLNEVIISLDGSREVHDRIRNIPRGFEKISLGVGAIKKINPSFRITARSVVQRENCFDFMNTVRAARAMGLDAISFLAADVSTSAFNRQEGWSGKRVSEVALSADEAQAFERLLKESFVVLKKDYDTGFIVENPEKIMRIANYYNAINGNGSFPQPVCNAPWVSAVIESDGSVMPCFFHKPYGNIYENDFAAIINSEAAIKFRKSLNVKEDPVCRKCVCSLKL